MFPNGLPHACFNQSTVFKVFLSAGTRSKVATMRIPHLFFWFSIKTNQKNPPPENNSQHCTSEVAAHVGPSISRSCLGARNLRGWAFLFKCYEGFLEDAPSSFPRAKGLAPFFWLNFERKHSPAEERLGTTGQGLVAFSIGHVGTCRKTRPDQRRKRNRKDVKESNQGKQATSLSLDDGLPQRRIQQTRGPPFWQRSATSAPASTQKQTMFKQRNDFLDFWRLSVLLC